MYAINDFQENFSVLRIGLALVRSTHLSTSRHSSISSFSPVRIPRSFLKTLRLSSWLWPPSTNMRNMWVPCMLIGFNLWERQCSNPWLEQPWIKDHVPMVFLYIQAKPGSSDTKEAIEGINHHIPKTFTTDFPFYLVLAYRMNKWENDVVLPCFTHTEKSWKLV